jgi:hypothetical protein
MTIRSLLPRRALTRRVLLAACLVAGALTAIPPSHAQHRPHPQHPQHAPAAKPPAQPEAARIYLLRGLFGIFSTGMDQLAGKLSAQGYRPVLMNWTDASQIVSELKAAHSQGDTSHIILIGHSLGSNAAAGIASLLDPESIPVDLVVTFDVTEPVQASANVKRFINFFQYNGFGRPVTPGPGFAGDLQNIDLSTDKSLTHGNIDEAAKLQAVATERIFEITHQHVKTVASARKGKRS